jgi:hypothetical protein
MLKTSALVVATPGGGINGRSRPLLRRQEVEALLISQIFLGINFSFDAELEMDKLGTGAASAKRGGGGGSGGTGSGSSGFGEEVSTALMIAQTEMFDLFTAYR